MKGPWEMKVYRRKNSGESIEILFNNGEFKMEFSWYPPWQNKLQRENAKTICRDLNAAFLARTAAPIPTKKGGR